MVDVALSEHKLPEKLSRLEAFKDRLTIIQSLSGEGFSGNHTAGYGACLATIRNGLRWPRQLTACSGSIIRPGLTRSMSWRPTAGSWRVGQV